MKELGVREEQSQQRYFRGRVSRVSRGANLKSKI
jgi:hypothetical protein